jgi:hypothetical protein
MTSITYWNRIEPRPRTDSLEEPLLARIRDPLWMLTRQWQLGEFRAEDTGTPAWVQLTERITKPETWQAAGQSHPLTAAPLEEQLEREPFSPDLATRIELGQTFERLLTDAGVANLASRFRAAYPIGADVADPTDRAEVTLRRICAGRAVDGVALYAAARAAAPSLPPQPPVPRPRQATVATLLQSFVTWVESTIGPVGVATDAPSWQPGRLEYAFTVTAGGGAVTLDVRPGSNGLVDWAAFDVRVGAIEAVQLVPNVRSIVPAHVRFRGMPNARFWDFEIGAADFGEIRPDKRDLARLALLDFMVVHANDWFIVPVDIPVGSIYQLDTLVVHDVFGVETLINRADRETLGSGRWTMFTTSISGQAGGTASFFLLPSSAGSALQTGRVVEEVRFARDEIADMVWGIENVLENQLGDPWPQHERDVARHGGAPVTPPPPQGRPVPLRYVVETRVPEHWIPFLPVSLDPSVGTVVLQLASQLQVDGHTPILPRGRIMNPKAIDPSAPYWLPEEEVPRNGLRVQRLVCRSRRVDGSTAVWQLRRVQPGTGEANSAMRFDAAVQNA